MSTCLGKCNAMRVDRLSHLFNPDNGTDTAT